ncbi:phenylacetate-CoA ligase [Stella humosa]|uniref:Phenylacetate-CoA ligase n=1 Tax=Stella humosa TaxID=94 RepID=A0A3N1KPR0_9PROT|nr:AMP-binding protein [Stella humosa]ROP83753.1 phenylacetate-CoA ligase [Stella humosa]BBK32986.1 coenzyme F390 synthetase [Stella humosa]
MGPALAFRDASATLGPVERLSRPDLEALQLRRLRRQLERLWHTNPFYRAKLEAAKVVPDDIRSLADFNARVPLSTKADFLADQQEHPPFGRRLGVPRDQVTLVNMTGGTSGQGQEVYGRTDHDIAVQGYLHLLPWFMAGLRPGQMALNCVPTGGLTTGGWGPPEGFRIAGATAFHAGGTLSTDAKIDLMLRFGEMHFIYASTNYLHTLSEALRRRGIVPAERFPMMRAIHIVAEGYPQEWARATEAFWGCRLHEGYGSTQGAGFIASTCEEGVVRADGRRGLMRLLEWINYVEVVDPETGQPVAPGEEGEIVLTNLDIHGSPVLRFSTRDRARFVPWQECGTGRAWNCLEAGTIGRYDDMLKIRGNNVWPLAVDTAVFAEAELAEYVGRVFIDESGRTRVALRLALKDTHAGIAPEQCEALLGRIGRRIKERTNVQMELTLVPRAELPVFTYKARRWTDERKEGLRA